MMKNLTGFLATILISLSLTFAGITDAEAKRFGGGGSFGGKSSYSSPFKRSNISRPSRTASQQKAYQQNQTARQGLSRRGGLMGMLGGLALGGLLGAMFFGGAFEGFNFMDILVFGGIAFLLYKLFAAKAGAKQRPAYNYQRDEYSSNDTGYSSQSFDKEPVNSGSDFDTDIFSNKNKTASGFASQHAQNFADQDDADFEQDIIPAGFDEADFLRGATGAFKDLQKAWDNRDLADIRGLTTDKVFAEIQKQLKASTEPNQTDVLKVDAELLSVRELGAELEAVVLFDSIIREDASAQAEQVREVWHFIKPKNSIQPKWYLDGIQQLEQ